MKWVELCLRNKLIIAVCAVFVCFFGIVCIALMPVGPFPNIQLNAIDIHLQYPGANAETVERQVTAKIVANLQSVNNIEQISASSQAGSARIYLSLNVANHTDLLQTELQIIQAISASNLPSVVPQPQISVEQSYSDVMEYVLFSKTLPLFTLHNFVHSVMVPALSGYPNAFTYTNTSNPEIKISLNPAQLAADHLNPVNISQLLDATYQSSPLGALTLQGESYGLAMPNNLTTLNELGNLVVGYHYATPNSAQTPLLGQPIHLRDVAGIRFESANPTPNSLFTINGEPATEIGLATHGNANPFAISHAVDAYIKTLQTQLPSGVHLLKTFDVSTLMRKAITGVLMTILLAACLVLGIVLIFLGRLRTTIIPLTTVPICLLGSMVFVYLWGFSLNMLSLLAMVIAVGLVVDDAIVVVENITRYLEQGMPKHQAIVQGTRDITLTIIAITLTLIAVYVPILGSSALIAELFKPFALTLAGAILISGITALTLTPVMTSALLNDAPLTPYQRGFDRCLERIIHGYHTVLKGLLRFRKTSLSVIVLLVIAGSYAALNLPQQLFPNDPDGYINVVMHGGAEDTLASMQQKLTQFAPFYQHNPHLKFYDVHIRKDPNSGQLRGKLVLLLKTRYLTSAPTLTEQLNQFIQQHHIANTHADSANFSSGFGDYDLSLELYGSNPQHLNAVATALTQLLQTAPPFALVTNQIAPPQKELRFVFNNTEAASLGINRQSIGQLLAVDYGGYTLNNNFSIDGLSVPIVVQLPNTDLANPHSLQHLMIQSPVTGLYYPLSLFVTLHTSMAPLSINTFNGQPSVEVDANLNKGASLSTAIPLINHLLQTHFPSTQYQYTGAASQYLQSNHQTLWIIFIGLACVYFVLTLLFKSLLDPLIIILTVPFSMIGGALSLHVIDGSINLYSMLGLITLVGLITKHGVLIVQFANQALQQGKSVTEAVLTATHHRFRPILMTTLAMSLGALPLIFSSDMLYRSRENVGVTLMGGVLIGTLFSLLVIPLVYAVVKRPSNRKNIHN